MTLIGSGIHTPAHLTQESIGQIKSAELVFALVPDPLGMSTLKNINPNLSNLAEYYFDPNEKDRGQDRLAGYNKMVEVVLQQVKKGKKVVCVFYGHPGIFVYPAHRMIELARAENYQAKMLPAIAASDCLYADLGIDPGDSGCISYEASQYLFFKHQINPCANLILWQIGVVGDEYLNRLEPAENGLKMLIDKLSLHYDLQHEVILYEASRLPIMTHREQRLPLGELVNAEVKTITTLVVPAAKSLKIDHAFCEKWQINTELL